MTKNEVMKMKNLVHRIDILLVLIPGFLVATLAVTIFSVWAGEIPRITPEELNKMIGSKADIVVVDNQPKTEYNKAHIPGAVNLPWAMEIEGPGDLPRDKPLILYCGCAHEEDSASMADQLIENFGYEQIKLLKGGLSQWQKLGYPIEKK
jgi:3-mercaptopyruvate sulfurtransferase SseA